MNSFFRGSPFGFILVFVLAGGLIGLSAHAICAIFFSSKVPFVEPEPSGIFMMCGGIGGLIGGSVLDWMMKTNPHRTELLTMAWSGFLISCCIYLYLGPIFNWFF